MPIEHRRDGDVAVLVLDHPPVNALGLELRRGLHHAFTSLRADATVSAVVILGGGKGFCAGGDRTEFGKPDATARPTLSRDVLHAIEHCGKPVVAALHGFAVGGGLELALACDLRVAVADTRIGLPEVGLGRFPLSGSQRLPRLVGIERAAEWMLGARMMEASHRDAARLFDRIVDGREALLPCALEVARAAIAVPPLAVRHRPFPDIDPSRALREIELRYPAAQCSPAQRALLAALRAAVDSRDFQCGLDRAQALFDELVSDRAIGQ